MFVFDIPQNFPKQKNVVLTIGTFDGVHAAHQKIIERLNQLAKKINGKSVLVTFDPHPQTVVQNPLKPATIQLLTTNEEKEHLLALQNIDYVVITPFTPEFANQSAEAYIQNFLIQNFEPHTIVIGYDHLFGKNRTGNFAMLQQYAPIYNFKVEEIPAHEIDNCIISSTQIRNNLLKGNVLEANKLLNYDYFIMGKIIEGKQLGRTIGFPTANVQPLENNKLIPKIGVYAVYATLENDPNIYNGMMNIGYRPTVDSNAKEPTIEVHLLDFEGDIYNKIIKVCMVNRIRDEQKFENIDALIQQLHSDKQSAQTILENL